MALTIRLSRRVNALYREVQHAGSNLSMAALYLASLEAYAKQRIALSQGLPLALAQKNDRTAVAKLPERISRPLLGLFFAACLELSQRGQDLEEVDALLGYESLTDVLNNLVIYYLLSEDLPPLTARVIPTAEQTEEAMWAVIKQSETLGRWT